MPDEREHNVSITSYDELVKFYKLENQGKDGALKRQKKLLRAENVKQKRLLRELFAIKAFGEDKP